MIKDHIIATRSMIEAIESLKATIGLMPEGRDKHRMELIIEQMRDTANNHRSQSESLYDQFYDFSRSVAHGLGS